MTILEVGAEGGSITLNGEQNASGDWAFWLVTDESMLYEEFKEELGEAAAPRKTNRVSSFSSAMELLDVYPWISLYPLEIHPAFRSAILLEVRKRGTAEDEAEWTERLQRNQRESPVAVATETPVRSFHAGMIVELSAKPEWGPGKIGHIDGDKLHIIFRDREDETAKVFLMGAPALREAALQSDPILDNLPPLKQTGNRWHLPRSRMSFEGAKRKFLRHFPRGFSDPHYLSEEREYKVAAHDRFQQELGLERAKELLASGNVASIISQGSSILNSVHLIHQVESAAFHDAMLDTDAARTFYAALFQLLAAPEINAQIFELYTDAVISLPAARGKVASWPVATALPYIAQPGRFMFLKPEVTKVAAETLAFDLHYDPKPNWTTYEALLRMGNLYLDRLRHIGAQDFIDVQSFIFVIGGGYD